MASCLQLLLFILLDPDETAIQRSAIVDDLQALGVDSTANCQVQIRSSNVPLDRLLVDIDHHHHHPTNTTTRTTTTTNESTGIQQALVVLWGCKKSSLAEFLKDHASFPVICMDMDDDETNTTAKAALLIAKFVALYSPIVGAKVRRRVESIRQAALVEDSIWKAGNYIAKIEECYDQGRFITGDTISLNDDGDGDDNSASSTTTTFHRFRGKVRDRWESSAMGTICVMVTTDRQSGFDRQLAMVPFKGAVLNLCSQFWFRETTDIIPNHLISVPHPAVAICIRCQPFPIEFVVRSYMTGSTDTSIWKNYQNGVRRYCGHELPDGMTKNQKLPTILLTPTTKEDEGHDRPISLVEIVQEGFMSQADLDVCADAALKLFARGQHIAAQRGLVLVDTKYEFGKNLETSTILLIDEIHTPDSSRYWLASSVEERVQQGLEPENIDKEFLRLWFRDRCDPYDPNTVLPEAPRDLVVELSKRYIQLYEMITWENFPFHDDALAQRQDIAISEHLRAHLMKRPGTCPE